MTDYIHRFIYPPCVEELMEKRSFDSADEFQIKFTFSCSFPLWIYIKPQDPTLPCLIVQRTFSHRPIETYILVKSDLPKARKTLDKELQCWPVQDSARQNLIEIALEKAREAVGSKSPDQNSVSLHFQVHMILINIIDEGLLIRRILSLSAAEECYNMVPTEESSIESLEKKTLTDSGRTCSVCLEEFSIGCEGFMMPCFHVFHGDCIKKWLRTSHYCPVCRFEMPTTTTST